MRHHIKFAIYAGISLIALSAPALAQEARSSVDEAAPDGDIVVTASRRSERLQDVPLAVSAISGEQLAEGGFQTLTDIQYQFSGVQFGTSPNDSGFRLRGVGSVGGFSSSSEQNVGTVVDNVVVPFGNPCHQDVEMLTPPQIKCNFRRSVLPFSLTTFQASSPDLWPVVLQRLNYEDCVVAKESTGN